MDEWVNGNRKIGAITAPVFYLGGPKWPKMRQKEFFFR
jgi:hypothetical protein